jgi:pimeloyl-ACP methyl ester carboxylesterase
VGNRYRRFFELIATVCAGAWLGVAQAVPSSHTEGETLGGASYALDMPAHWNHKLLLYSHGYRVPGAPNLPLAAPANGAERLLRKGFALLGSSYRSKGWAVEVAPLDQLLALDAFEKQHGKPKRVIAWGDSMGALVTIKLVEEHPDRIDGAVALCGSVVGTAGMMNQALDAAFALKVLVDPQGDLALVGSGANDPLKVKALIIKAASTPEGQARLVLAGVLAQIPLWSDELQSENGPVDVSAAQKIYQSTLMMGAFFPRDDQERRAGGNGSWNVGVDYAKQLDATGRRGLVETAYASANLDLSKDLAVLAAAPRIAGDRHAANYLKANYAPSGRLARPVVTLHTTGDAMTMASYESTYRDYARAAGKSAWLRQLYVRRAGHCTYAPDEAAAAVLAVDARLAAHRWVDDGSASRMNAAARALGDPAARFVDFEPVPALRPCQGLAPCLNQP